MRRTFEIVAAVPAPKRSQPSLLLSRQTSSIATRRYSTV
jgi:hypothetical protein